MVASTEKKPSKTAFVTAYLQDDNLATLKKVNAAWTAAGHPGTVSSTLVTSLRGKLGLTGNIRSHAGANKKSALDRSTKATNRKAAARPAKATKASTNGIHAASNTTQNGLSEARDRILAEIEADLDRLIFKLMGVGGFERLEDELRAARRVITRSHTA